MRPRKPAAPGGTTPGRRCSGRWTRCTDSVDKRQTEHELHRALRTADAAEEDATAAIEVAAYFLNVAEYAVIDATLARMAADDLAAAAPASTSGVTS